MSRQMNLLVIVVLIGIISCNQPNTKYRHNKITGYPDVTVTIDEQAVTGRLKKMLHQGLYFKFDAHYSSCRRHLPEKYQIYFDIVRYDLFGYPELLEVQDHLLLKKYYASLTEPEKVIYHLTKISHYQKKYDYKNALAEVLKLETFSENIDTFLRADIQQWHASYFTLQHTTPMTVKKYSNNFIQLEKARGHLYIPVTINGNMVNMVFDTGAGKSLISKSLAESFGLKIYETKTEITGATGARAATNLGIADKILIGNTIYEHAVFEVIEDSLLGVPAYNFFFDGLVGLNLLYPLGSLTMNAQGTLKIGECSQDQIRNNLAVHLFSNRVPIIFQDDTIPVKFDTGTYMSIFNRHFYESFKSTLLANGKQETTEYGGIGGLKSIYNMIHIDSLSFGVYNDTVILNNTWIHSKYIHKDTVSYYGQVGLDFVDHFHEISMHFTPNSIYYRNRN